MDETLDDFDMTSLGVPFYQYKLPVGSGGGFIWSAKFETSSDSTFSSVPTASNNNPIEVLGTLS